MILGYLLTIGQVRKVPKSTLQTKPSGETHLLHFQKPNESKVTLLQIKPLSWLLSFTGLATGLSSRTPFVVG